MIEKFVMVPEVYLEWDINSKEKFRNKINSSSLLYIDYFNVGYSFLTDGFRKFQAIKRAKKNMKKPDVRCVYIFLPGSSKSVFGFSYYKK